VATRHQSHAISGCNEADITRSRHSGCVDGCSGSDSGWWVDDCWLVTGVIFVVTVSIRSMKSLGVRAQTVADFLQKLKTPLT